MSFSPELCLRAALTMQPGTKTVGRYELLAELGRGAMGIVYKARDPKIDRLVAIKTISLFAQTPEEDREFRERLFVEARAAGRLSHPGIVTVFDVGEDPDTLNPYIVMEYVPGPSLEKEVSQQADRFPLSTSLSLVEQVAEALDYAHSQGIVHRDIKPGNILLPENGPPKITDFGIAKLNCGYQTPLADALGTPAFMSPEQLNGESVDGRSDLFSLGVVLYTLVTGYRPFQGNSALTVSFKVVNRNPLPATAFDSAFPPEIDSLVSRAMAKDPAERYQTGKEMAAALRELRELAEHSAHRDTSVFDTVYGTPSANLVKDGRTGQSQPARSSSALRGGPHQLPSAQKHSWLGLQYIAGAILSLGLLGIGYSIFHKPAALPSLPSPPISSTSSETAANNVVSTQPAVTVDQIAPVQASARQEPTSSLRKIRHRPVVTVKPTNEGVEVRSMPAPTRVRADELTPSTLQVRVEHRFRQAEVIIWIDDKLAYDHTLDGTVKKRMVVFKGVEGYQSDSMRAAAGEHRFRVRVHSTDNTYDQTASVSGTLPKEGERQLLIQCEKKKPIRLSLQ